ncbi:hypothetical protein [Pseudonocardia sp. GCM10023141]
MASPHGSITLAVAGRGIWSLPGSAFLRPLPAPGPGCGIPLPGDEPIPAG